MEKNITLVKENKKNLIYMKDFQNFSIMNKALDSLGIEDKDVPVKEMQEMLYSFENFIAAAMKFKKAE